MSDDIKKIPVFKILSQAFSLFKEKKEGFGLFVFINFIFLETFMNIEAGLSNKISILWILSYYAYWFAFFRYNYGKKPYLFSADIFGSLIPSTKMFFLVIVMSLFLGLLPYLPLFMGFDDKYLLMLETYMQTIQDASADTLNMLILSIVLIMILPFILCRPFLAFISSVQGLNGSLRKAWKKSVGNYWRFILIMLILNLPCFLIMQTDKYFELNGNLNLLFNSFYLVYYNLVFAKIYDFFYVE